MYRHVGKMPSDLHGPLFRKSLAYVYDRSSKAITGAPPIGRCVSRAEGRTFVVACRLLDLLHIV